MIPVSGRRFIVFCEKCGAKVVEGSKFCGKCGAGLVSAADKKAEKPVNNAPVNGNNYNQQTVNGNYLNNQQQLEFIPVTPDGKPLERDDYLEQNQEYATQKVPIITLRVILLVVGALLVLAGLVLAFISVFAVTNTYRSLIIILVLLALMIFGGVGLCIISNIYAKKKLDKIGDQFYERYLECLSDKSVTSLQINV